MVTLRGERNGEELRRAPIWIMRCRSLLAVRMYFEASTPSRTFYAADDTGNDWSKAYKNLLARSRCPVTT